MFKSFKMLPVVALGIFTLAQVAGHANVEKIECLNKCKKVEEEGDKKCYAGGNPKNHEELSTFQTCMFKVTDERRECIQACHTPK